MAPAREIPGPQPSADDAPLPARESPGPQTSADDAPLPARESPGPQPSADDASLPAVFIFTCDGATTPECFRYRVLGLPRRKLGAVSRIRRGAALFLYDFDARYLYGPYRADSDGGRDLEPAAFQGRLPAQVKFMIHGDFMPVRGKTMRYTIKENYPGKFLPELTFTQVEKLRALFRPITSLPVPEAPPLYYVDNSHAAPSTAFLHPSASSSYPTQPASYVHHTSAYVLTPAAHLVPNEVPGRVVPPHELSVTNPQLVMHYGYAAGSEGATGETTQVQY
uniref:Predicted protein n=1 Tax=Hordeum vulgare subsp. vulgare TaxID=112509 RepID=F2E1Q4_HORVV|nr:predicted protein [Hordeum vulgare subsp. vulgare]